jgi:hypothetical protein
MKGHQKKRTARQDVKKNMKGNGEEWKRRRLEKDEGTWQRGREKTENVMEEQNVTRKTNLGLGQERGEERRRVKVRCRRLPIKTRRSKQTGRERRDVDEEFREEDGTITNRRTRLK